MVHWHIITGEYPPQPGGVSDYSRLVALGLAGDGAGDEVHVWAPAWHDRSAPTPEDPGVTVHRLPDHFGPKSLKRLGAELDRLPGPRRLLLQYVPHAFGYRGMNVPLTLWLARRGRRDEVWAYFHEVAMTWAPGQPASHRVLALVTRFMADRVARSAHRRLVAIPTWEKMLRERSPGLGLIEWQPVPSNIPVIEDPAGVAEIRSRFGQEHWLVGHFGTFGSFVAQSLDRLLPRLIQESPRPIHILLLGRGNTDFRERFVREHPELAASLQATGPLTTEDLSRHLSACDLMLQPYDDGVSCRRGSLMACVAHGRPVATTTGHNTEPIWAESGAVALAPADDPAALVTRCLQLLADPAERDRMGQAARQLHRDRFAIENTIQVLRQPAPDDA